MKTYLTYAQLKVIIISYKQLLLMLEGQTDMSYQGEYHLFTKQNMQHHVCPNTTICTLHHFIHGPTWN